jgi:hypothetical protein
MSAGFPWRPLLVLSLAAICFIAVVDEIALRVAQLPASGAVAVQRPSTPASAAAGPSARLAVAHLQLNG